ncbi:MAG TPA: chorismate mutase [Thermomicrobiaceae bacterium]|nr:chorismate mutase [Thermomicrobiaceae bacterium]
MMRCRGIRGATTVERNDAEEMLAATRELLATLIEANQIEVEDVASVIFTTTPDLTAIFPAVAARDEGWDTVALICGHEMAVPGALDHVIRVLIHWNTEKAAADVRHVYLRRAVELRPEWAYRPGQALPGGNGSHP